MSDSHEAAAMVVPSVCSGADEHRGRHSSSENSSVRVTKRKLPGSFSKQPPKASEHRALKPLRLPAVRWLRRYQKANVVLRLYTDSDCTPGCAEKHLMCKKFSGVHCIRGYMGGGGADLPVNTGFQDAGPWL